MSGEHISREAAIIGLAASSLTPRQIDDAAEALRLVPAADVVEVIRCKDCEYWMPDGENVMVCTGAMAYCNTDGAWYCAFAKRRGAKNAEIH